jgi:hypothetical protein
LAALRCGNSPVSNFAGSTGFASACWISTARDAKLEIERDGFNPDQIGAALQPQIWGAFTVCDATDSFAGAGTFSLLTVKKPERLTI